MQFMLIKKFFLYPTVKIRLLQHIIFWGIILLLKATIYGSFYALDPETVTNPFRSALMDVVLTLPLTIVITYFTCYFIVAQYLLKGHLIKSLNYFFISATGITILLRVFFFYIVNPAYNVQTIDNKFMDILQFGGIFVDLYQTVIAFLLLYLLRKNMKNFYEEKDKREKAQVQNQQLADKLNQLQKTDFSHILFNNLNNLYALTLEKSPKASKFVLALSTLINFTLFEQYKKNIKLKVLTEAIKSYLYVEETRFGDKFSGKLDIQLNESAYITPNLFFEVIDFAMKATTKNSKRPSITIKINNKDKKIILKIYFISSKPINTSQIDDLKQKINYQQKKDSFELNFKNNSNEYEYMLIISSKINTFITN